MSLNLSAIAVRERAVTLFFILLLAAAGAYAFFMLGRAEDPSFTIKTLTVTTVWPGATAREMQDQVAEPLEKSNAIQLHCQKRNPKDVRARQQSSLG